MKCDDCNNANICLDHIELPSLGGCTSGIPDRKSELRDFITMQGKISCVTILQTLSQLKEMYEKEWNTVVNGNIDGMELELDEHLRGVPKEGVDSD